MDSPARPEPQPVTSKPKLRWFQFSLRSLLIATAVLAFVLGMVIHYRTHLYLRYVMATGKLAEAKAIPVSPMPETPEPKGWVRCRFGSLQFGLPPKMAANVDKRGPLCAFSDGSKSVVVALPEPTADTKKLLETEFKLPPEGQGMSGPRLRMAWCQASSADFRWTTSPGEVRWHAWCLAMNSLFGVEPNGWAETMFGADFDGILFIREDRKHATFDWQDKNKAVAGFVYFKDNSSDPDPAWVRCVCMSVQVRESGPP